MRRTEQGQDLKLLGDAAVLLAHLTNWEVCTEELESDSAARLDGMLRIEHGDASYHLAVECKRQLSEATLPRVFDQLRDYKIHRQTPVLLLAPYIAPRLSAILRKAHQSHMDLTGTVYLELPGLLLWFGRPTRGEATHSIKQATESRLTTMTVSAARLVYALLTRPERVNWPYRVLAECAGVSVGVVNSIFDYLQRRDFVRVFGRDHSNQRALVKRRDLLDQWVESYGERLRPKILVGRYTRVVNNDALLHMTQPEIAMIGRDNSPEQASLGGSYAATTLTDGHFRSGKDSIFFREGKNINRFLAQCKLQRDPEGDVELMVAFWPREDEFRDGIVPPLVAYAELLLEASSRSWEAAQIIYDRYLKERIEHD